MSNLLSAGWVQLEEHAWPLMPTDRTHTRRALQWERWRRNRRKRRRRRRRRRRRKGRSRVCGALGGTWRSRSSKRPIFCAASCAQSPVQGIMYMIFIHHHCCYCIILLYFLVLCCYLRWINNNKYSTLSRGFKVLYLLLVPLLCAESPVQGIIFVIIVIDNIISNFRSKERHTFL